MSNQITNGIDRKARADMTYSADAKKAREAVRQLATHSLTELAEQIVAVTSEQAVKHKLQGAVAEYRATLLQYAREELRDDNFDIGWMGPKSGLMPAMPEWAPEHKAVLARAWNAMLMGVNETTKVGVHKLNRYRPIELQVELGDGPQLVAGGVVWN